MRFADREHARLHRREPGREGTVVVLDKHRRAALERAGDSRAYHHDALFLSLFVNAGQVETLGDVHVQLYGRYLPLPAGGVCRPKVELRSVERGFARALKEGRAALRGL